MLRLTKTAAAHYFGRFQRDCRAVAGSRNDLTDRADARSWACPRSGLRWEHMKTLSQVFEVEWSGGWGGVRLHVSSQLDEMPCK